MVNADKIWDVGGNNGHFSRQLAFNKSIVVISDLDPMAVNQSFFEGKKEGARNILSLLVDVVNPTPAFGFGNYERTSFLQRMEGIGT